MPEENQMIWGVVTANPELLEPVPLASFAAKRFMQSADAPHDSLRTADVFLGAVLAVAFPHAKYNNVLGSAVMVGMGIALTAAHVVQDCLDDVMSGNFGAMCVGLEEGHMTIWQITHVAMAASGPSDIAVLSLSLRSALPKDRTLKAASITTRTPQIGETLKVLGFRQVDDPESVDPNQRDIPANLYLSTGRVGQQFRTGRGSFCGPCVQLDCETQGGMSGGPVFDEQGLLVGILSAGIAGGTSLVSLLWPALGWPVTDGWPSSLMKGERSLLELFDKRLVYIEGRDALQPDLVEDAVVKRLRYVEWQVAKQWPPAT